MRNTWLCVFAVVFLGCGAAWGATINVTTTEYGIVEDGLCSLVEAVENANEGGLHADCVAGENGLDVIELGQGETYFQPEGFGYYIEDNVIIDGNGSTLAAENGFWWGVYILTPAITAVINELTIRDAHNAVVAVGTVILNRCTFTHNQTGVHTNFGTLIARDCHFISNVFYGIISLGMSTHFLIDSVFADNRSGILVSSYSDGPVEFKLSRCTVTGNEQWGVYMGDETATLNIKDTLVSNNDMGVGACALRLSNSTVSGNTWSGVVRAWCGSSFESAFVIESSTLSGNGLGLGAGAPIKSTTSTRIEVIDSTITANETGILVEVDARNNIIAGNDLNCSQGILSRAFNISDDDSCNLDHPTDMVVDDVMLSELGDYGGTTPVHMPLEGSPAVDMINWEGRCSQMGRDQRGYHRPGDGDGDGVAHCDCGAVEVGGEPPVLPPDWPPQYPNLPPVYE